MKYKAAFFDRDNTLVHGDAALIEKQNLLISSWSNKPFIRANDLFERAGYPDGGLKSIDEEICFWKRLYREMLVVNGISEKLDERAEEIFQMRFLKGIVPYPETIRTLEYFRLNGYKMGVISDTSPSLELTIRAAGLDKYFDSYTCSDIVGVMKPDPRIYNAALSSLGVSAAESLYVDDYDVEADGARTLGFTAFHIVRNGAAFMPWDIENLYEMVEYADKVMAD